MRIIHTEGFDSTERQEFKDDIAVNIHTAINTLMDNMTFAEEEQLHSDKDLSEAYGRISMTSQKTVEAVFERADDIALLWQSPILQAVYQRRNQFQLIECARYFLNQVHKIMDPEYVPNNQDIVQTRVRTEGIIEHTFEMDRDRARKKKRGRALILVI